MSGAKRVASEVVRSSHEGVPEPSNRRVGEPAKKRRKRTVSECDLSLPPYLSENEERRRVDDYLSAIHQRFYRDGEWVRLDYTVNDTSHKKSKKNEKNQSKSEEEEKNYDTQKKEEQTKNENSTLILPWLKRKETSNDSSHFTTTKNQDENGSMMKEYRYSSADLIHSPFRVTSEWDNWNPREIALFECALLCVGKRMREMSAVIGTKSVKECVRFYYAWKHSSHYLIWKRSRMNHSHSLLLRRKLHHSVANKLKGFYS